MWKGRLGLTFAAINAAAGFAPSGVGVVTNFG